MARKGNGEGTIYYHEKLNKWTGQFIAGRKADGTINRKTVYGKTRKEVKEKMTKALAEVQNNSFVDKSEITLNEIMEDLINRKYNANIISSATYMRTKNVYDSLKNNLGNMEIQKITSDMLQDFFNKLIDNYSNSSIDKFHTLLSQSFKEALQKGIIYKNPLDFVIKPKSKKQDKEVSAFTIEEQQRFIEAVKNEKYKDIYMIDLYSRNENW